MDNPIINNIVKIGNILKKDGWENVLTGLGVQGRDKRLGSVMVYKPLAEREIESLYDGDDIAQRVVDLIPTEGTRDWIECETGDPATDNSFILEMERLDLQTKVAQAWKYSRLYRGAGIFLSVDDGLPLSEPINVNRFVKINSLVVLTSYELVSQDVDQDLNSENFGMPLFYHICPSEGATNMNVHHSRIIRFEGSSVSRKTFISNGHWGESVLTRLHNVLRNFNLANDSAASILQDFNVGILKMNNLAELIGADEDKSVLKRLRLMNLAKSILGTILLDSESETYENKSVPLANVDNVLEKVNERLVAATDMPHNKILAMGPKTSLAGGGDSEEKDWLTNVANKQNLVIRKPLDRILNLILLSKQGPTNGKKPNDWTWNFKPLWQPSQKETVESRNKQAQTDKIYWEMGALQSSGIAKDAFSGEEYSFERTVDLEAIKAQEKAALIDPEKAKKIIETGEE